MAVWVTCPECKADTGVTARDRECDECGSFVPDSSIEYVEPPVGSR